MDKVINKKIEDYLKSFKNDFKNKVVSMEFSSSEKENLSSLLEFVFEYPRLTIETDELIKKKREKVEVPLEMRCTAKRSTGEQCTRRKKRDCDFCGTHDRSQPHGALNSSSATKVSKVDVFVEDIEGIIHYIDNQDNVYKTEDILSNKINPTIVGKVIRQTNYVKVDLLPEISIIPAPVQMITPEV